MAKPVDLVMVARRQRWLIRLILIYIVDACCLPYSTGMVPAPFFRQFEPGLSVAIYFFSILLIVATFVVVILLLVSLRASVLLIVLCANLGCVPVLSLLIMLVINLQATRKLREAGLHVGFLGVREEDVIRLQPNLCGQCGYDLTGNVSGICPECGTAVAADSG